ncbi:MAG: helicase, partial [Clostridia bacterium]|nr:helicase [Clostridia bacterium]
MLHFILGPSGSGKTTWIRQRIVEASRERQGGILYLVPEQNNFESERAVLTLLGSMSTDMVEVVSFTRLAEWALGLSGQVKEAAPDSVKVMVMGRALREIEDELKLYKRQVGSTEFCRCVLELDEELRRARIPADKLLEAASGVGGTFEERVRELSLLIETYRGKLQNRFRDPLEDLDRLTEVLDRERPFVGKTVFIDSFKGFTEQQFSVLERLICQAEDVYLALLTDGRKDLDSGLGLFSNVKRTAATLARIAKDHAVPVAPDVCMTEDHRFGGNRLLNVERFLRGAAPDEDAQGGFLTVCACANVVDEADYVARTIRRLVRTEGYRYRDFAVVARHIEECQALLVYACERYKIPCFN